jgi:hypothetical protein
MPCARHGTQNFAQKNTAGLIASSTIKPSVPPGQ